MSDELRAELEGKKTALNAATSPEVRTRLLMDCARLHEQLGDFPAMGRMAFEAAKLSPESLEATQLTRRAFVQARKWVAVMPWFQSELALTEDPAAKAALYRAMGDIQRDELHDAVSAEAAYQSAAEIEATAAPPEPEVAAPAPAPEQPDVVGYGEIPEPVADADAAAEPFAGSSPSFDTTLESLELSLPPPPQEPSEAPPSPEAPPEAPPSPEAPREEPAPPPERPARRPPAPRKKKQKLPVLPLAVGGGVLVAAVAVYVATRPTTPACPAGQTWRDAALLVPDDVVNVVTAEGCWADSTTRDGPHVFYDGNHAEVARAAWVQGKREGEARLVQSDGSVLTGRYVHDERHGVWRQLDAQGGLLAESPYDEGLRHGTERTFRPDGSEHTSQEWQRGKRHGPHRELHANGKVKIQGRYRQGEPLPGWEEYDAEGRLLRVYSPGSSTPARAPDYFAGRPLSWWNLRLADLRGAARKDASLTPLLELTVARAKLNGLTLDAKGEKLTFGGAK